MPARGLSDALAESQQAQALHAHQQAHQQAQLLRQSQFRPADYGAAFGLPDDLQRNAGSGTFDELPGSGENASSQFQLQQQYLQQQQQQQQQQQGGKELQLQQQIGAQAATGTLAAGIAAGGNGQTSFGAGGNSLQHQRVKAIGAEHEAADALIVLQRRCALALADSALNEQVDWAVGVLLFESNTSDIILSPAYQLLDHLLRRLLDCACQVREAEKLTAGHLSFSEDGYVETSETPSEEIAAVRSLPVDADIFQWGVPAEAQSLWSARQLSLIIRNLSFVPENEVALTTHQKFVPCLLLLVACDDISLSTNALHTLANVSSEIMLEDNSAEELLGRLFGFLFASEELHAPALESLIKLAVSEANRKYVLLLGETFFKRLDQLLFSVDVYVQDLSVSLFALFASFATARVKTTIAELSAAHLMTLLRGVCADLATASITREQLSFAEHMITAIYHLASEPANALAFKPYLDAFLQIAADVDKSAVRQNMHGLRNILYNIIAELGGSERL